MTDFQSPYLRARRFLLASGSLLIAVSVLGISEIQHETISILPFKFEDAEKIPHLLAAFVVFALYDFSVTWKHLHSETRITDVRIRDVEKIRAIGIAALAVYIYFEWEPFYFLQNLVEQKLGFTGWLAVSMQGVVWGLVLFILFAAHAESAVREEEIRAAACRAEEGRLRLELLRSGWIIEGIADFHRTAKPISFAADGSIQQCSDDDLSYWHLNGTRLEIFDPSYNRISEFSFDYLSKCWLGNGGRTLIYSVS